MNICLIPARIGSKRIKKKNIKKFYGKPLISYAIHNAKKSKLFKRLLYQLTVKKLQKLQLNMVQKSPF